jgi:K+/H+ antiporter YhaU regulatory subunit KhtT
LADRITDHDFLRAMEYPMTTNSDHRATSTAENLKRLRELLTRTNDEAECQRIVKLIEEEEAKKPER